MKKEESKAHAKYGASNSDRWTNCHASIALCEQAPPQKTSAYAQEGTDAHSCLEVILKAYIANGRPYSTAKMLEEKYPAPMVRHALEAFKEIERMHSELSGGRVLCETKIALPVSEPDQFGTVDAAIVELFGKLIVIDFKYGAGIPVNPEDNSQLCYYALGLAHQYDYNFEEVEIVIIQPRAEVEGGPVRRWTTTVENLLAWRVRFEEAIQATKDPFAKYATGKWCRFCPAATICPELSDRALQQAQVDFDPIGETLALDVPQGIQIQNLSAILNAADRIETWLSKVREHAEHCLERGEKIPGWKLVAKRSTRKWTDFAAATKAAHDVFGATAFSEPELLSPAQLEKAVKSKGGSEKLAAKFIQEQASNLSSGTTLVAESDPRPPVNLIESDFAVQPEEQGEEVMTMAKKTATKKKTTKTNTTKKK